MGTTKKAPSKPQPSKRIVSAARSKQPKKPYSIRLTADQVKKLDAAAAHRHLSRSDLIVQAIERCLTEDAWTPGESQAVSGNVERGARERLVELSNVLVGMGFAVGELIDSRSRKPKRKEEAVRVLAEAQQKLAEVMIELRC